MDIMQVAAFVGKRAALYGRGFWYVATPYSKYPAGLEQAFIDASTVTARLVEAGVPAYSPIAHTHPIAVHGKMDKLDHSIWLPLDEHMMKAARGIIVAKMAGWGESYGVGVEIEYFEKVGKPVLYLDTPPDSAVATKYTSETDPEMEKLRAETEGIQWTPEQMYRMGRQFGKSEATRLAVNTIMSSEERKNRPLARGVLDYFPDALMEVAAVSKAGNDKHNPGQPMHHARGKSTDHADCIVRHLKDRGKIDPETGQRHSGETAWRALALLQEEIEAEKIAAGCPLSEVLPRGAKLPEDDVAQKHVERGAAETWSGRGADAEHRPNHGNAKAPAVYSTAATPSDYPSGPTHLYFPFAG